jgi:hypothetical protein
VTWLLLVVVCALIGYRRYAQHESATLFNAYLARHRSDVDKDADRFPREKAAALAIPQLQIKTRTKDAGARLNSWVSWRGAQNPNGLQGFVKRPDAFSQFLKKLRGWDKTWAEHAQEASLGDFDFSWMKELRSYDFWHLDAAPPVKQALQARQGILPIDLPSPDPASLDGWTELRLLAGLQQRSLTEALADTSHLATLLFSAENVPLAELGLHILAKQRQAAEQFRKSVDAKFDFAQARIPSEGALASAGWLLQKSALFFSIFTDRDTIMELFADEKPDPLGCAVANTRGPQILRSQRVVGDLFADNLKALARVLHQEWKDCGLARLRPYWDGLNTTTSDLAAEPFIPPPVPELLGFEYFYPVFEVIAKISRRDQGTLPAIMEYSSALRRAMGIAWARQGEY